MLLRLLVLADTVYLGFDGERWPVVSVDFAVFLIRPVAVHAGLFGARSVALTGDAGGNLRQDVLVDLARTNPVEIPVFIDLRFGDRGDRRQRAPAALSFDTVAGAYIY